MVELFLFGFLLGIRHALEADHVAAVATLLSHKPAVSDAIRLGSLWGIGHTLTLLILSGVVLFSASTISEQLASLLEFAVGGMLVFLAIDVLRRLWQKDIRFSNHRHAQVQHIHLLPASNLNTHKEHIAVQPWRVLMVGMMHGMAGTVSLLALTLQTVASPSYGILYILLFGVGSMLGMALMSLVIVLPLQVSYLKSNNFMPWFQGVVATVTLFLGADIMFNHFWS